MKRLTFDPADRYTGRADVLAGRPRRRRGRIDRRVVVLGGVVGLAALLAVLLTEGGGGHEPDWDGYARYLNAEVRDDPITAGKLADISGGEVDCGENVVALAWDFSDADASMVAAERYTASVYFRCGEDAALDVVWLKASDTRELRLLRFVDETLAGYAS